MLSVAIDAPSVYGFRAALHFMGEYSAWEVGVPLPERWTILTSLPISIGGSSPAIHPT
jgi:hypothetical protein